MNDFRCPLTKFSNPPPANEDELTAMRRRAWREQGVLVIPLCNWRLTSDEQDALKEIGERLYGYNREDR